METKNVPWWKGAVFYTIYPLSFKDSNGDGIGDLGGIIEKLDYLNDGTAHSLGVDAIWLTPIFRTANADYGYDVIDYCNIDTMFGDLKAFRRLLEEAHKRGIRVLLDFVPNHTSSFHPWFLESRFAVNSAKRDWYIWHEPLVSSGVLRPPTNKRSVFRGSAWTFDPMRGEYYFHQFYREQPDLNWRNREVRREMRKALRFWLKLGVDGFRFDAVSHLRKDYFSDDERRGVFLEKYRMDTEEMHSIFREFRKMLDRFDDRVSIAEVYANPEELVEYYGKANDEFHMAFNFSLLTLQKSDLNAKNARGVIKKTEECFAPRDAWPNYVLGNHDRSRIAARCGKEFAPLLAMLQLTLRGSPTLYYGEEIGMSDAFVPYDSRRDRVGRDKARTPMQWDSSPYAGFSNVPPWLPVNPNFDLLNVRRESEDPRSLLSLYRKLIWLRKERPVLAVGEYHSLDAVNPNCFAYIRELDRERYLVVLNFSGSNERVSIESRGVLGVPVVSTHGEREEAPYLKDFHLRPYEGCLIRLSQ